jgi:hypothetical protein
LAIAKRNTPIDKEPEMAPSNVTANDQYLRRLETELQEKESLVRGIYDRANQTNRDINEEEGVMVAECRSRMEVIKDQMEQAQDVNRIAYETRAKGQAVDQAISIMRGKPHQSEVEYRSAGEYMIDMWHSAQGGREASDRLEVYSRAADHQRTGDSLGVIPDPIVGPVIDFIDAARPLVSTLGVLPLTSATFYRPVVTQHPTVGFQGAAGGPADEKSELDSQKMIINRLTVNAKTLGGYVNVSRQAIDFSSPSALDLVVNGPVPAVRHRDRGPGRHRAELDHDPRPSATAPTRPATPSRPRSGKRSARCTPRSRAWASWPSPSRPTCSASSARCSRR